MNENLTNNCFRNSREKKMREEFFFCFAFKTNKKDIQI